MNRVEYYKIGDCVKVVQIVDDEADINFIGHEGVVQEVNYHHGCGEVPNDPMIKVFFNNLRRAEWFWKEELKLIEEWPKEMKEEDEPEKILWSLWQVY